MIRTLPDKLRAVSEIAIRKKGLHVCVQIEIGWKLALLLCFIVKNCTLFSKGLFGVQFTLVVIDVLQCSGIFVDSFIAWLVYIVLCEAIMNPWYSGALWILVEDFCYFARNHAFTTEVLEYCRCSFDFMVLNCLIFMVLACFLQGMESSHFV